MHAAFGDNGTSRLQFKEKEDRPLLVSDSCIEEYED